MTDRTRARVIGLLFIVASVAAIIGGTLVAPVQDATTLAEVAAGETGIVSGVLIEIVMVSAVVGIAALFFPVLRRTDEGLAMGYVGARVVEGLLLLAAAVSALVVVGLARADAAVARDVELVITVREMTYLLGSLVALGIGSLLLYGLLLRSRIVPRWLSAWGLTGAVLILARGMVEVYGAELSGAVQAVFAAPIGIGEMVLAGWLIVKGLDTPTPTVPTARPATPAALSRR